MTTVHIIFNAHLDPIWLWSWREGLDEVLNTSYYICNLLDRHPDIIYTRGEAWVYEQIQRVDPPLFQRVKEHVKAGRWSTVGGWYIQPDCNLPSGFAMERQIEIGRRKFLEFFGEFPKVGYNVDSFGHSAALPELMRRAGQEFYVMMRPGETEAPLPARLFRWRGHVDGREIITFRIASDNCYCTPDGLTEEHVRAAISGLPAGISHTMCFVGIGNHGGGPTEEMIQWCRDHRTSIPGVELVFSSPSKYFAGVKDDASKLPEVIGELQMHAVGCYSVHRSVKLSVRKAEHRLIQAESILRSHGAPPTEDLAVLEAAWKRLCFHHFHDTLCGTCTPSAYQDVDAQLGDVLAAADDLAAYALRKRVVAMADDPAQRIVLLNASDRPFEDYVEVEPFLEWTRWQPCWRLLDEAGRPVTLQIIDPESNVCEQTRLLFSVSARPGELQTFRIVDSGTREEPCAKAVTASHTALLSADGPSLRLSEPGTMDFPLARNLPLPFLALYDDPTDTWSHFADRFARVNKETAAWQEPRILDKGPLMSALCQQGTIGSSELQIEWRIYHGKPWIECRLRVGWMEKLRILKFEWKLPWEISKREDGIMEGSLIRETDGCERPVRDWVRLELKRDEGPLNCAVVAPEIFSVDCEPRQLAMTLLRSPAMAWHKPGPDPHARSVYSDRGEHFFRFRFLAEENVTAADLDQISLAWQRPPLFAELTRGMRNRNLRAKYTPIKACI
jgi:alpha-mannosidase